MPSSPSAPQAVAAVSEAEAAAEEANLAVARARASLARADGEQSAGLCGGGAGAGGAHRS